MSGMNSWQLAADYRAGVIVQIDSALQQDEPAVGRHCGEDAVSIVGEFVVQGAERYLELITICELKTLAAKVDLAAERLAPFTYNQKAIARDDGAIRLNGAGAGAADLVKMLGAILAMERDVRAARDGTPSQGGRISGSSRAAKGKIASQVAELADGSRTAKEIAALIDRPVGQVYSVLNSLQEQGIAACVKAGRGRSERRAAIP